jgi:D-alanyl-D-alanine carboxypeptidase
MAQSGRRWSRSGGAAGLRRLLALLGAAVLVLTLVGSGSSGTAGAVQPQTASASGAASPASSSGASEDLVSTLVAAATPILPSPTPTGSPGGALAVGPTSWPSIAPPSPRVPPVVPPVPVAKLQARLDQIRARYSLPGVAVTIIWPDGRIWTGVSGWADVARRIPVVAGTAFSIGSVSKTFLAALVLELVQEHRLRLDDPVRKWLPSAHVSKLVTIRELLDHTSGVYDFFDNKKIDKALLADPSRVWTPTQALSYLSAPYCAPGTCWVYSNSNYVLLGQVVEKVTGRSPTAELRRRFFDPLGLGRTFVQGAEARRGVVATAYKLAGTPTSRRMTSLSDGTWISPFTSVVTAAGTAGDIAASSADLAAWGRALYGGSVLAPASLAQMMDTTRSTHLGAPTPYGFAVSKISLGGRLTYGHNGRLVGARASIRYLPDSGFTIAVVTNQDIVGPDIFGTALLDIAIAALSPAVPVTHLPAPQPSPSAMPPPAASIEPESRAR